MLSRAILFEVEGVDEVEGEGEGLSFAIGRTMAD
tara:strand:- start:719 stop:820 length:102 start_codon:yes stop_codon:yes gene_type:complete